MDNDTPQRFEDKEKVCKDCKEKFLLTWGQQRFLNDLVKANLMDTRNDKGEAIKAKYYEPVRCQKCLAKRRALREVQKNGQIEGYTQVDGEPHLLEGQN